MVNHPRSPRTDAGGLEPPADFAGRYEIERVLGQGGTATVYLARDRRYDRLVALKALRPELAHEIGARRFLQEIEVTARLQHPHIAAIIDSGESEGVLYLATQYLEGETLRVRLESERQLSVECTLLVAREAGDALQYAHDHGVIHRDIKPENILLSGDHAFVVDFGIAQAVSRAAGDRLTASGLVLGTPAYMSPEQGAGEPRLDGRSDQYALACVLYEMLGGMPPFVGPTPESVIAQRFNFPPRPLHAYRPSVPGHIEAAISRALSITPADRFLTMRDFVAALGASPNAATPSEARVAVTPPRRATRSRAWMLAAGAVAAAGAFAYGGALPFAVTSSGAVERGSAALKQGDPRTAERWLRRAATRDADDPSAQLWLAQMAMLFPSDSAVDWRAPVRFAMSRAASLDSADRVRATALGALAEGSYVDACRGFRAMQRADPRDITAALDLVTCLERDSAVVPDERSPSGYRFRSSHHETVHGYRRVLEEMSASHPAKSAVYERLMRLVRLEWGHYFPGYSASDRDVRFAGMPALLNDSLVLVPYRLADLATGRPERELATMPDALERGRGLVRRAAERWVREFPRDATAHAIFARVLELEGDIAATGLEAPSALAEVRRARSLSTGSARELRLLTQEVRLLVKASEFEAAVAVADSALRRAAPPDNDGRWQLAALAALTGRARLAADLLGGAANDAEYVLSDGRRFRPHPELAETALRLTAFCAVGAPVDSILAIRARIERQFESYAPAGIRLAVRARILARSLAFAVPVLGASVVETVPEDATPLVRVQRVLERGALSEVRSVLDSMQDDRQAHLPGAVMMDEAYHEAWLRAAAGDTAAAVRQLDALLGALPTIGMSLLDDVSTAAAFWRAVLLRAEIAERTGDAAAARRWNEAAATLLRNADPEVRPL